MVLRGAHGRVRAYVKGSPEAFMLLCHMLCNIVHLHSLCGWDGASAYIHIYIHIYIHRIVWM
jgi:hypothetical protein